MELFFVEQMVVPGNTNNVLLDRLQPDTPYSVNVVALYADGEGGQLADRGRTCRLNTCFSWSVFMYEYVSMRL